MSADQSRVPAEPQETQIADSNKISQSQKEGKNNSYQKKDFIPGKGTRTGFTYEDVKFSPLKTKGSILKNLTSKMKDGFDQQSILSDGNLYAATVMHLTVQTNITSKPFDNLDDMVTKDPSNWEALFNHLRRGEGNKRSKYSVYQLYGYVKAISHAASVAAFYAKQVNLIELIPSIIMKDKPNQFLAFPIFNAVDKIMDQPSDRESIKVNEVKIYSEVKSQAPQIMDKLKLLYAQLKVMPDPTQYSALFTKIFGYYYKDSLERDSSFYSFNPRFVKSYYKFNPSTGYFTLVNDGLSDVVDYLEHVTEALSNISAAELVRSIVQDITYNQHQQYGYLTMPEAKFVYDKNILIMVNNMNIGGGFSDHDNYTDAQLLYPHRHTAFGKVQPASSYKDTSYDFTHTISPTFNFYGNENVTDGELDYAALAYTAYNPNYESDIKRINPINIIGGAINYADDNDKTITVMFNGVNICHIIPELELYGYGRELTKLGVSISPLEGANDRVNSDLRKFTNMQSLLSQFDYHPRCVQGVELAVAVHKRYESEIDPDALDMSWSSGDPDPSNWDAGGDMLLNSNHSFTTVQWEFGKAGDLTADAYNALLDNMEKKLIASKFYLGNN